jgi:antitoxin HicB
MESIFCTQVQSETANRCRPRGIREAAKAEALTRVLAWQLKPERQCITKAALAERMQTSRAQVDRILKAKGNVTIKSL